MAKREKAAPNPEFEATLERIMGIAQAKTQVQLAAVLQIQKSCISSAKQGQSIPDGWLVKLQEIYGVLPSWIKTGQGQRLASEGQSSRVAKLEEDLHQAMREVESLADIIRDAIVRARTTMDEFMELKSTSRDMLVQAQARIKDLTGQLRDMDAELTASRFTL